MKGLFILALVPGLLWLGCSKQEAPDYSQTTEWEIQTPEVQNTPSPAPQAQPGMGLSEHLAVVQSDLEARRYQEMADRLVVLQHIARTPEQEQEYKRAVFEAREALREQAQNDPAAAQAYHSFGRRMMGR